VTLAGPIREAFIGQANVCRDLGSPLTAQICERLVEILDGSTALGRAVRDWALEPVASALALRLCGALHRMVRASRAPELARCYPPNLDTGAALDAGLRAAIAELDEDLVALLASAPQTNEVARSGILLGGLLTIAAAIRLPLALHEIGASAGLYLHPYCYAYDFGQGRRWGPDGAPLTVACDWRGAVPPLDAALKIASRCGADLAPIDPADIAARERVLSYIWPDQALRLERTAAAIAHAAAHPVIIDHAEAADWVEARLAAAPRQRVGRVLMHSISWQYFPTATQHRIAAALETAGADATSGTPLAWLRLEPDSIPGTAAISLTMWPGGITRTLGRGDYHGRFAEWNGA